MQIGGRDVEIHRAEKVQFPDEGITKGDMVDDYAEMADVVLSHLRDRPVGLERWPDGLDGEGFVQRDPPDQFPDWIDTVEFPRRTEGSFDAPVVESPAPPGLHDLLQDLDLPSWVQTTGSKGFHVVVPLDRTARADTVREFATDVARVLTGGETCSVAWRGAVR